MPLSFPPIFSDWLRISVSANQLLLALSIFLAIFLLLLPIVAHRSAFRPGWAQRLLVVAVSFALPVLIASLLLGFTAERLQMLAALSGMWVAGMTAVLLKFRQAQALLVRSQRNAAATLDAIADAVINVAPNGNVLDMNPVARQLMPRQTHRGRSLALVFDLNMQEARQLQSLLERCLNERRTVRDEHPIQLAGRRLRLTAGPIFKQNREVSEVVLALTDVTEAVEAHERLYYEATHDALTGLPNRALVIKQLASVVSRAMQSRQLAAVLFLDIDHFNRINDSLGHRVGDAILVETANRLKRFTEGDNLVARWGGDEYVLVLTRPMDRDEVARVAESLVRSAAQPIHVDNLVLHMTCSVGVSITPADSIDVSELMAMADTAMARAKLEGNGGYRFFSSSMSLWNRNQIDIETSLRHALQNKEFELLYQPQAHVASGELAGMEALLRWNRASHGVMPPDEFVPVAEEVGLIIDIGIWAIYQVTQQLRIWHDAGLAVVPVAVNVSARQCLDHRIAQVIAEAIAMAGINPAWLKIELTESTAMNNVDQVASLLRSVDALGVGISVDDFGTGYSSLSFLKRFPISQLKIDRSFVSDITTDTDDAAIVAGTIALAHGLGIEVVAEGVETTEQYEFLAQHGCDFAQGYYFSVPISAEAATTLLAAPDSLRQQLPASDERQVA